MVAHIALFRVGLLLSTGLLLVLPVSILLLLIQCGGGSPKNGKKGGGGNDKKEEKKKGKVKDKKSKPKREVAKVDDVAGAGGGGGAKKKKHKNKKDTPPAAPAPAIGGGGGAPKPTGPRMIEDGKHEGMADQQAYQTLGNLDRDIFVQGQGGSPGAPPAPPPPSPAAAHQMPSSIRAAPQSMNDPHGAGQVSASDGPIREGLGQGQDYQTWNNLDQNVFDNGQQQPPAPAPSAPAPRPPAANEGEGNESMADGPIREGLGQGQDYQTWNNLDQNVFVQ